MKTQFDSDLYLLVQAGYTVTTVLGNAQRFLKDKKMGKALQSTSAANDFLCNIQRFLGKYESFLQSIDQKFGTKFEQICNSARKLITEIQNDLKNININISVERIDIAKQILNESTGKAAALENELAKITTLPHIIDFSKLTHDEWRKVGVAGVHYRSRIFLSYPFRDSDLTKDENQKFMDYLIKPLLNLLNIEPVTARSHLHLQECIEENTIALIADCDGIIGFYTADDPIGNVEHELANNENVIAICKEEGAKSPTMRRSRLQLDFIRNEPSQLLIQIISALKNKQMFNLAV